MKDALIIAVLVVIIGLSVWYMIRAKKKGVKCIGCPEGTKCGSGGCAGCTGCGSYSCSCQDMK